MDFLVLGSLQVHHDDAPVDLGGARQRAVLARLVLAHRDVVPVDRLIDDLWRGQPTPSAMGVLQAYVSNLRRILEPERAPRTPARLLVSRAPGYALEATSDAEVFTGLVADGVRLLHDGDAAAAAAVLDNALAMWRGSAYADLADEDWAGPEIVRLEELRLVALEHRIAADLVLERAHAVIAELEVLVGEHPVREGFWRLLALALYRTDRQADALAALRRCALSLRDELGLEPSLTLSQLERAILDQDPQIGAAVVLPVSPTTVAVAARETPEAAAPPRLRLRGRDLALATLRSAATAATSKSRPQSVLVTGEAGIGKSWLIEAFGDEQIAKSWQATWGHCHETSGAPALWPWLQMLTELDQHHRLPPTLRALVDGESTSAPDGVDARSARFRQHESVRRYLAEASEKTPLLVVVEDLQWADAASAQLLADVVTMSRSGRLLCVATSRDPTVHAQMLARLDRSGGQRVALAGLGPSALSAMSADAGLNVSGDVLHARTGGNPFLVRETLRLVSQVGQHTALSAVPDSVGEIVRQRLRILPPEAQTTLHVAAVLGRDVNADVLREVSGQAEDEVWDAVDAAVLTGILIDRGDGTLRFSHDLMRETLYADLAPLRRSRLHARAMHVLEDSPLTDVSGLAEHAHAAGPLERTAATRWASAAAEQAQTRLAHEDAARWWARAVDSHAFEPHSDPRTRVDLLMSLLHAQLNAGDAVGARETRNRAILAADALDDETTSDRALLALDAPTLWLLRQFNEVELGIVGRLERTLARLPDVDGDLRCRVLATLAAELYDAEPDPRCDAYSADAVEMARRLGDPALLVIALNARYLANNREAIAEDTRSIGQGLIALGTGNGWPDVVLLGHLLVANYSLSRCDITTADEHAAVAERLNRRLDLHLPRMQQHAFRLCRLQLDGRFTESQAGLGSFAELALNWWAYDGLLAAMRLTDMFLADQLTQADEHLIATAGYARPTLAHDVRILLDITPRKGPWPEPARDWGWLAMMMIRAEAASVAGDDQLRRRTHADLAPFAGRIAHSTGIAMPVDWALARLARSFGDPEAARGHLAALEAMAVRESLDWWADRARNEALAVS